MAKIQYNQWLRDARDGLGNRQKISYPRTKLGSTLQIRQGGPCIALKTRHHGHTSPAQTAQRERYCRCDQQYRDLPPNAHRLLRDLMTEPQHRRDRDLTPYQFWMSYCLRDQVLDLIADKYHLSLAPLEFTTTSTHLILTTSLVQSLGPSPGPPARPRFIVI